MQNDMDALFYLNQTKVRGLLTKHELKEHCKLEARRIEKVLKYELELLKKNNAYVLDVPCGYGNLLSLYKDRGIQAIGYDLDDGQVQLARLLGLNAFQSDVMDIKNNNIKFHAISSFDFLEHIHKNDAIKVLNIFFDLLEPGGYLILRMPCGDGLFGLRDFADDPTHKWIATSNCMRSVLSIHGFSNIKVYEDWSLPKRNPFVKCICGSLLRWIVRKVLIFSQLSQAYPMSSSMIIVATKPN